MPPAHVRRAARGLLDMHEIELAAGASVSKNTIVDFEKGRRNPTNNNLAAIQRVLEEAGVEFTNGDAPGLRLRKKKSVDDIGPFHLLARRM